MKQFLILLLFVCITVFFIHIFIPGGQELSDLIINYIETLSPFIPLT